MIYRIDTADDPRLAPYRLVADPDALAREGLFAVEGRLVVPRLLESRYRMHSLLASESALASLQPLLDARAGIDVIVGPAHIVNTVSGFHFHRGCVALGHRGVPLDVADLLEARGKRLDPVIVLEQVSNPDNIGGIFRSAHAFGARGIVIGPGCGDPLYRKAIRTSMGATLDVPWTRAEAWPEALATIRAGGCQVVALVTDRRATPLHEVVATTTGPLALMLGSEGFGLSDESRALVDTHARIPMPNEAADSLNVSAAATIALYETVRGRA